MGRDRAAGPRLDAVHPLGCHRPHLPDRVCLAGIVVRLAMGCSWEDAERLLGGAVSDTTLRARRDEWIAAGVFDTLVEQAQAAYDRIVGLDLSDCSIDGSQHKAPTGGEGTGPSPTDRGKLGWKWSLFTDRNGIPVGWATAGANRHDSVLVEPTLLDVTERALTCDVETLHLDRGYDNVGRIEHRLTGVAVNVPRLLHGYERTAWPILDQAARRGYDVRIGLEDTLECPDGKRVDNNEELVRIAVSRCATR